MPRCVDAAQWTIRLTAFLAFGGMCSRWPVAAAVRVEPGPKRQRLVVAWLGGFPGASGQCLSLRACLESCQGIGGHGRADCRSHRCRDRLRALPELRLRPGLASGCHLARIGKASHENRPAWVGAALQCFMALMWFNATVVFGSPWGSSPDGPPIWPGQLVYAPAQAGL
ncbi:MAG: hypothetical protein CM1200mP29_14290 [Verrucomicrobiota bacterium]|nr:MAG: hypothetical protein CM1200mP29_14290 [Verrucomicrobiota bacterium]